eukprot:6616917-Prymnesium_polylepis.1
MTCVRIRRCRAAWRRVLCALCSCAVLYRWLLPNGDRKKRLSVTRKRFFAFARRGPAAAGRSKVNQSVAHIHSANPL